MIKEREVLLTDKNSNFQVVFTAIFLFQIMELHYFLDNVFKSLQPAGLKLQKGPGILEKQLAIFPENLCILEISEFKILPIFKEKKILEITEMTSKPMSEPRVSGPKINK